MNYIIRKKNAGLPIGLPIGVLDLVQNTSAQWLVRRKLTGAVAD
jgi:hypothetical protein